mgnify:CR=1 FL=1
MRQSGSSAAPQQRKRDISKPGAEKYVEKQEGDELVLTFDEIGTIAGVPLDHSFLNYKKVSLRFTGFHFHSIQHERKFLGIHASLLPSTRLCSSGLSSM